ncbi:hypothetical protein [Ferviditalea candida]|uniref:Uncharacterized protein n=1 Tax=Ferviditalea candida TaxID=3108399 RepID=A0ABU5ZNS2_9BACL|nr:hypothetical protein [Paenibacillaceae bacterium T2]
MIWKYASSLFLTILVVAILSACKEEPKKQPVVTDKESLNPIQVQPTEISSLIPVIEPNTTNPSISKTITLAEKPLKSSVKESSNGFQIEFVDAGDAYVMQSFSTPRKDAIVHVVRRTEANGEERWYRKDLLLVRPESKEVRTFMLMHGRTDDSYTSDSVTNSYGFLDEENILYTAVHGMAGTDTSYNIEKMNIYTGEKTVLFTRQPENPSPDFFTPGWLTNSKEKLVLPTFSQGKLHVFDLKQQSFLTAENRFPSSWPMYSIFRSPDGERFWHGGKLYDLQGRLLSELKETGNHRLAIHWSPDNQFSAQHYAFEDGDEHRMSGGESDILGPQGLVFIDRSGKISQRFETEGDIHVELVGWIPKKQTAIIQYYQIDKKKPINEQRINATYKAVNVVSGQTRTLTAVFMEKLNNFERAETWSPYSSSFDYMFFVDLDSGTYWRSLERAYYLGQLEDGGHRWMTIDYGKGESVIYNLQPSKKKIERIFEGRTINPGELLLNQWFISIERQGLSYKRLNQRKQS